jgi:GT2 family glycosyltransferase
MRKHNKTDISIIIVNYHVQDELIKCIRSIVNLKTKSIFEIIVVDNDEDKKIKKELQKKFPKVIYVANENKGYGQGNNRGVHFANGEYLYILNPDTIHINDAIDTLLQFLDKNPKAAIAAPLLYDTNNSPYPLQGTEELTPLRAIFSFSFINKLFPKNNIAKEFWLNKWDKKSTQEVKAVPGTAFVIRKDVFKKLGGFDERFFLYFEEFDLCKRVTALGYKIYMVPSAKLVHLWGMSTKTNNNVQSIFSNSRFYYFKKHFGLFAAYFVETFLRFSKYTAILVVSLAVGFGLAVYKIGELMSFIGDYAWFYLSARDMITQGVIPLVGITSSHPWLHQGAFWTYLLVPTLYVSSFNPVSGAYLSILFFVLSIFVIYKFGSEIFSKRVASIASLFYATSPLILLTARTPYHTAPIPFFTLVFFYTLYKWIKGNASFFPLAIFVLAILYNFEIATSLLAIVLIILLAYGIFTKKEWLKKTINKKIVLYSFLAFIIPMIPMLLYDSGHGFPQTIKVVAWIGYKILVVFGYPQINPETNPADIKTVLVFIANAYQKLIYPASSVVAIVLALVSFGFFFFSLFIQMKSKKYPIGFLLLAVILLVSVGGIIATKTTSDAYLPILFPIVIYIMALFFDQLFKRNKSNILLVITIILIACVNSYTLIQTNYFIAKGYWFTDRIAAAKKIISESDGRRYNLKGKGQSSNFSSFTLNYEYTTWWLGKSPVKSSPEITFFIAETPTGIKVIKQKK